MNYLIIPAYQPDLNLVKLVRLVHAKSDLHIIVVDDGSDADKKAIFDKLEGLATVLTHEHNQGKGQALKTAYAYILERGTYGALLQLMQTVSTKFGIFSGLLTNLKSILEHLF